MAKIIPFKALRPVPGLAAQVASLPYDVCSTDEARAYQSQPHHFYHVTRSEIDLPREVDVHSEEVYDKALENLNKMVADGVLLREEKPCYYLYKLVMNGREQTGILCGSSIEDYNAGVIKKHEFTRPEKELDRINHIKTTRAQTGIVFMAYRNVTAIDDLVAAWTKEHDAAYSFIAEDGIHHEVWVVNDDATINRLTELFASDVPCTYIADGHHRAASAAKVAAAVKDEAAQYFLTCIFPESQLKILDYNRVVKDLDGYSAAEFLNRLEADFIVEKVGDTAVRPAQAHEFGLYLADPGSGNAWYKITAREGTFDASHPIGSLDVSILQNNVLTKILHINDPRTDKRVEFVGGIRGLGELEKRVNSGEMAAAFSCHPVSLDALFKVADSGEVMPPKSTWFEPKTRDGLIVYTF